MIKNDPCETTECGNMAECVVEEGLAKCQCPSCGNDKPHPVCASDQKSYRSMCDAERAACLGARELNILRRSPCSMYLWFPYFELLEICGVIYCIVIPYSDPCEVYNEETKTFDIKCDGLCALNGSYVPQCCDALPCEEADKTGLICGSNGRTYISVCAMKRYACKTGNVITQVATESCPTPKGNFST